MRKVSMIAMFFCVSASLLSRGAVDAFWFNMADGDRYGLPFASLDSIRNDGAAVTVTTKTNYRTTVGRPQLLSVEPGENTGRVDITFSGGLSSVSNAYAFDGVTVSRSGADVVVNSTIDEVVTYRLCGSTGDGSFSISSLKEFVIVLDGVSITNGDGAAIDILSDKKATISLVGKSFLGEVGETGSNEAAGGYGLLSGNGDIFITGDGSLRASVVSAYAIIASGCVEISSGNVTVVCPGDDDASSDIAAVKAGGDFRMSGGLLEITHGGKAGKGIRSAGDAAFYGGIVRVESSGSAGKCIESYGDIVVADGALELSSSGIGGKCIESYSGLTINGGEAALVSMGDCIGAASDIKINGGTVRCEASYGDAVVSDGYVAISGGTVVACGAVSGAGFDCGENRLSITGGLVIGIGGASDTEICRSDCSQPVVFCSASNMTAESEMTFTDSAGVPLFTFLCPCAYGSRARMIVSSPWFVVGGNYRVYKGGTVIGGVISGGVVITGSESYIPGSQQKSFTVVSMVYDAG